MGTTAANKRETNDQRVERELNAVLPKLREVLELGDAQGVYEALIEAYKDYSYNLISNPEQINGNNPNQLFYIGIVAEIFNTNSPNK
jgi:hypothetical protein